LSPIGCKHLKLFFFFLFLLSFCFVISRTFYRSGKPKRRKKKEKKYVSTTDDDRSKKEAGTAIYELKRHSRATKETSCFVTPCRV
jgi:hypothetical protein